MSNQTKDKDVLAAILNVKKYASNLKKKASNLQDPNEDKSYNQVTSTPAFFQQRPQQMSQLYSPMLAVRSSYRQPIEPLLRQKKQHSMTVIPGSRKAQKESRKISQQYLMEPASPSKTYNPSGSAKPNLSQSYRLQSTSTKLNGNSIWKKDAKNKDDPTVKPENKKNDDKDNSSQIDLNLNRTFTLPPNFAFNKLKEKNTKQQNNPIQIRIQNPNIIKELLQQIQYLKSQLNNYKKALILLRTKYLQMQQKCNQKAQLDHDSDLMKMKIIRLQQKNQNLTQTIIKQNQKIVNFDSLVIEISKKFLDYFAQQQNKIIKLQTQNQVYKKILEMKAPNIVQVKNNPKAQEKNKESKSVNKNKQQSSESQTQPQSYAKPLNEQMCKKQMDMKGKYNFKIVDTIT